MFFSLVKRTLHAKTRRRSPPAAARGARSRAAPGSAVPTRGPRPGRAGGPAAGTDVRPVLEWQVEGVDGRERHTERDERHERRARLARLGARAEEPREGREERQEHERPLGLHEPAGIEDQVLRDVGHAEVAAGAAVPREERGAVERVVDHRERHDPGDEPGRERRHATNAVGAVAQVREERHRRRERREVGTDQDRRGGRETGGQRRPRPARPGGERERGRPRGGGRHVAHRLDRLEQERRMRRDEARGREAAEAIAEAPSEHVGEATRSPPQTGTTRWIAAVTEQPPGRAHRHRQPGRVERDDGALVLARHVAEGREEARREARAPAWTRADRAGRGVPSSTARPGSRIRRRRSPPPRGSSTRMATARARGHDQQDRERGCEGMQSPARSELQASVGAWTDRRRAAESARGRGRRAAARPRGTRGAARPARSVNPPATATTTVQTSRTSADREEGRGDRQAPRPGSR